MTQDQIFDLYMCGVISRDELTELCLGTDEAAILMNELDNMNRETLNAQLEWDLFDNFFVVDDCSDADVKLEALGISRDFLSVEPTSDTCLMSAISEEIDILIDDFEYFVNLELDEIAAEEGTQRCVDSFEPPIERRLSSR